MSRTRLPRRSCGIENWPMRFSKLARSQTPLIWVRRAVRSCATIPFGTLAVPVSNDVERIRSLRRGHIFASGYRLLNLIQRAACVTAGHRHWSSAGQRPTLQNPYRWPIACTPTPTPTRGAVTGRDTYTGRGVDPIPRPPGNVGRTVYIPVDPYRGTYKNVGGR
jgi:hypothetical protein